MRSRVNTLLYMTLVVLLLTVSCVAERLAVRDGERSESNSNSTAGTPLPPIAIANITASAAAVCIICSMLCYLGAVFNKQEQRERVRRALERNKQIERQMAASRARQVESEGARERDEKSTEKGALLFSAVHTSHNHDVSEEEPLVTYHSHKQPSDSQHDEGSAATTITLVEPIQSVNPPK